PRAPAPPPRGSSKGASAPAYSAPDSGDRPRPRREAEPRQPPGVLDGPQQPEVIDRAAEARAAPDGGADRDRRDADAAVVLVEDHEHHAAAHLRAGQHGPDALPQPVVADADRAVETAVPIVGDDQREVGQAVV